PVRVTRLSAIAHGPVAAKPTDRPDDAVAVTPNGGSPTILSPRAGKPITCAPLAMVKERATSAAARGSASPACEAVTVQLPAPVSVITPAATAHDPAAPNDTGSPEDTEAVTAKDGSPNVRSARVAKAIDCAAGAMPNDRDTSGAAA